VPEMGAHKGSDVDSSVASLGSFRVAARDAGFCFVGHGREPMGSFCIFSIRLEGCRGIAICGSSPSALAWGPVEFPHRTVCRGERKANRVENFPRLASHLAAGLPGRAIGMDEDETKVGYEIPFTRHYKYVPPLGHRAALRPL